MDSHDFPTTLPEFLRLFPDDAACARFLERLRWPNGFVCPKCKTPGEPYRFSKRKTVVVRCRACQANVSLAAGTIMERSHIPLLTWFRGAYVLTTQDPEISVVEFQRQLGLRRYETAHQMFRKFRRRMLRAERDPIGHEAPVEVSASLLQFGKNRSGCPHAVLVAGAVEIRSRQMHGGDREKTNDGDSGRVQLCVLRSQRPEALRQFVQEHVVEGAIVRTDGSAAYEGLSSMGYVHEPVKADESPAGDGRLLAIHSIFAALQIALQGMHDAATPLDLQDYLNAFTFRFNRRSLPCNERIQREAARLFLSVREAPPVFLDTP